MCLGFSTNEDDDELLTVRQRVCVKHHETRNKVHYRSTNLTSYFKLACIRHSERILKIKPVNQIENVTL